jgi:HK97 gp10 family phage protein
VAGVTVTDNSDTFKDAAQEAVVRALESIGLTAEAYAKLNCPVDTGRLRNSITHTVDESGQVVYIGTNVEYAAYVELGTVNTKAQPYIKPAVSDHADEYRTIAENALKG